MAKQRISMVVFDWAGTTVDYASSAPAKVFDKVFSNHGVKLTASEINGPMGMEKKAHIRSLLSLPSAQTQFSAKFGREPTEDDVNAFYDEFEGTLADVVADYSSPIPGAVETVSKLRASGLKIGSTTGYTSEIMKKVVPAARAQGYEPDCVVTPDIAGSGRPGPFMVFECMKRLGVFPPSSVVKVGDTAVDMAEGKNAGAISVGILDASNMLGLSQEQARTMDHNELERLKADATRRYLDAGADYVIGSITELPELIERLDRQAD
jgi:phosphonoacetaldehyde hydrolase